jgi:hypothetical protein
MEAEEDGGNREGEAISLGRLDCMPIRFARGVGDSFGEDTMALDTAENMPGTLPTPRRDDEAVPGQLRSGETSMSVMGVSMSCGRNHYAVVGLLAIVIAQ